MEDNYVIEQAHGYPDDSPGTNEGQPGKQKSGASPSRDSRFDEGSQRAEHTPPRAQQQQRAFPLPCAATPRPLFCSGDRQAGGL